jgi:hypothetical protein
MCKFGPQQVPFKVALCDICHFGLQLPQVVSISPFYTLLCCVTFLYQSRELGYVIY